MPKALICGVAGQDGSYLAKFLLNKGYQVFGTSRDAMVSPFGNLHKLGIYERVETFSMAINDFRSVLNGIEKCQPDEIYNLAGQTSVALSFEQPIEATESIVKGTLNILEALRYYGHPVKFYNAGSSECFGETIDPATEHTPFSPRSPYAVAKASAHWFVKNYREAYGLFACTGILFNHESPLRPERFVTQKIVGAAARIAKGSNETLQLGNIDIFRDWGWAPDYVEAMWLMLQCKFPEDYLIATGESHSLREFTEKVFFYFGLDWRKHVTINANQKRPTDIESSFAKPDKARIALNWVAKKNFNELINILCESSLGN